MGLVFYNPKTNELGLFDFKTLVTQNAKYKAHLVIRYRDLTVSEWVLIGEF